jgi:two-component system, OmpR family, phosphate regulon sensor histidine kinase PhoR
LDAHLDGPLLMWRSRMFWRLFLAFGVLILGVVGLLGVVLACRVERHHQRQVDEKLHTRALLVREVFRGGPLAGEARLQERVQHIGREIGTRVTLIARDGRVLADSEEEPARMENHADRPEIQAARDTGSGTEIRQSRTLGEHMQYVALRVDEPGSPIGYVRVALPRDNIQNELAGLDRLVWTAAVVTGLGAMVLAFWLARRAAAPLQELTHGAERIAAGEYGYKVYAVGTDETGQLAKTFNHMSERLASQFAQLEEDRQQLRTILSGMVEGVIALDAEQRVLFANERAAQVLGLPARTSGRRLWEVVRHRALQEVVGRALASSEPCQGELHWDGPAPRSLTVHAARLPGSPGRGAVLVLHDTTELKRLERVRQEFVANVSHELKTPLSVIKACVETLLDGAADDPQHRGPFLEQIAGQADRLHALILDLLSLARIEAGTEAFDYQAVSVGPLVARCLERHRARADGQDQRLEAVAPAGEPALAVWADEEAVGEILDNLVDNALKYTPAGGRVWVRWQAEDGYVGIEVGDTGIGIPQQDLPRIFERFYRVDKARAREKGGTGLGLSIVKHLVQAMQGTVEASSRVGAGTLFRVRLPRPPAN